MYCRKMRRTKKNDWFNAMYGCQQGTHRSFSFTFALEWKNKKKKLSKELPTVIALHPKIEKHLPFD